MRLLLSEWVQFLEGNEGVLGLILIICGLGFLLTGWRFARVSLVAIYGLVGMILGCSFGSYSAECLLFAVLCGCLLSILSVVLKNHAAPILAGILGSLTAWVVLGPSAVPPPTIYIVTGLTFVGVLAVSVVSRREAIIVLTSFVGALLVVSGLIAVVSESRSLALQYRSISGNGLFFPLALLVPTVSGILLQLGASNRSDAGNVNF